MFGCKTPKKSQHTVARGIKGVLNPQETKSFNLQAFCADSSLSWPNNSVDYDLTSFKLKGFDKNTDQSEAWRKIR